MADIVVAAGGAWPLAWCVVVLFAAYGVRGATGFGAGVIAIPLLLLVLPVPVVIPVITVSGLLASLGQAVHQRRHVDWRAVRGLVLPTLAGVGIGLWLFATLDPRLLLKAFAVFIIGYALWSFGSARFDSGRLSRASRGWLGPLAGALGGFVATVFGGMAGPFYVVYLGTLPLDKTRFRATIATLLLGLSAIRVAGYGGLGLFDARVLALLAVSVPVMVAATLAGDRWHHRLDEARFRRVVAALMAASGVALLFK
jgi:uncharacterized membrane protein YfcA